MENLKGLLRIRLRKGTNLAVRDSRSSDPYVTVTMGEQGSLKYDTHELYETSKNRIKVLGFISGEEKLKSSGAKNDCNPEWNDELTLSIKDLNVPITLTVYDKDTLTVDDKMGDAEIDLKPYIECLKMGLENLPNGSVVKKVQPSSTNCLAEESTCVWNNGKIVQDMSLRLRNVESGEVSIELEWIDISGCEGL